MDVPVAATNILHHETLMRLAVVPAVLLIGIFGCRRSANPVIFVIPVGYSGVIEIEEDPKCGAGPQAAEDGSVVILIPADGKLRLDSFAPFERYHHAHATYQDGRRISTYTDGEDRPLDGPDGVMLRDIGVILQGSDNPRYYLHVGTGADYRQTLKKYELAIGR